MSYKGGLRLQNKIKKSYSNQPLISIITVVYNAKEQISDTIESVKNQSYQNIEYIIIDGGSTDGTKDIIEHFNNDIDYWISQKDNGIYDAMNKAISVATGDFIFFLGADDILIKNSIDLLLKEIDYKIIDPLIVFPVLIDGKKIAKPNITFPVPIIHHQGALFNRQNLKQIAPFSSNYKIHADFDLMCRYINLYGLKYIQEPICNFSKGGTSTNGANAWTSSKELLFIYFKNKGNIFSLKWIMFIIRPFYYFLQGKFSL